MEISSKHDAGNTPKFVEELPELFKCGVCRLVLQDPYITECCGKNACRFCITKAAEDGGPCPIPGCGCQNVKINFNRGLRSDILESSVYCQSKEAGCEWVGKLDELSKHLKECLFVEEECQYHCGVQIQRLATEDHKKVCKRLPIDCHQCGEMYERCHHRNHLKVCPFTKYECPFHIAGCKSKVANKDLQQHFNKSLTDHYTMVVKQSHNIQTQLRETKLMTRDQNDRLELDNADINRLKVEVTDAIGTVSQLKHTLEEARREYSELQKVHDQLKGQTETHTQHRAVTSHMLKKDLATLTFESKVSCYGPALPSVDPANIVSRPVESQPTTQEYRPPVSFIIPNFTVESKNDAILCLPPFYSHSGGYKMCLIVYCNGYREANGKYLTVLARVLKGKYDDHLKWPLHCNIDVEIKKVYGRGSDIQFFIGIESQERAYEDNLDLKYQNVFGGTGTVNLSLLSTGPCLKNGTLTIDVYDVTIN